MGYKNILPNSFIGAGASFPKLYNDARITAGTLMLLDGGHSLGGLSDTVGGVQQNVAWDVAAEMIGSGTETTLSPTLALAGAGVGLGKELTTKGGLHIAARQTGAIGAGYGYTLTLPALIETYLMANTGHQYFYSLWYEITRKGVGPLTGSGFPLVSLANTSASTAHFYNHFGSQDRTTELGALRYPHNGVTSGDGAYNNALGAGYQNQGQIGQVGTCTDLSVELMMWGALGSWAGTLVANPTHIPSWVLYSYCIEDLTVSGRTYAQASAADYAAYQVAMGSGGKFAGDAYTAPATLAGA
ncbi:MAG: hypothetical protein IPL86_19315 [Flavobacteriales bacterium]|nr:hypothetical protein [Flavobacteriales bacterium]